MYTLGLSVFAFYKLVFGKNIVLLWGQLARENLPVVCGLIKECRAFRDSLSANFTAGRLEACGPIRVGCTRPPPASCTFCPLVKSPHALQCFTYHTVCS